MFCALTPIIKDANLAKWFRVVLGLEINILNEKTQSIFARCAIHMCSNKLREKAVFS